MIDLKPKIQIIERPNDITQTNIFYYLIYPYAIANIYYDKNRFTLFYRVIEPQLSKKELDTLKLIESSIKDLIFIKFSEIKDVNSAISYLERLFNIVIKEFGLKFDQNTYNKFMYYVFRDIYGLEKLEPLMRDPFIEDIQCSGVKVPVYIVHRVFGNLETNIVFEEEEEIKNIIEKIALKSGRQISYAEPLLDATLPDGSRVNATYSSDVTTQGPTITIRKFKEIPWTPLDLIRLGSASPEIFAYLWLAVEYKKNIIVIGGTSSGKTTLLNAVAMFIPPNSRIVSIEDTREIRLYHKNWIPGVVRYSLDKNREIDMFTLLKESFRQRPDYVIVGEVRGQEAYVMFQGMASGHAALSTMHAESTNALINRLITPPISLPKVLIELLNVVVIMRHELTVGRNIRRVFEVDEIVNYENYNVFARWNPFKSIYEYNYSYLFNKISEEYGINLDDLYKEFRIRSELLRVLSNFQLDPQTFFKIINLYYSNKEFVLDYYGIPR